MRWVFLIVVILIVLPFLTYLLAKIQMLGWLNAMKSHLNYQEQKQIKEEKANGKEEKTFCK